MRAKTRLPEVRTQQEFMDVLEDMILPPKPDDENPSAGRLRELKAYLIESDAGFPSEFNASGLQCSVRNTGLDEIRILNVKDDIDEYEFFLDARDPRFFILHTNERSDSTSRIMEKLAHDTNHAFDYAWLHSDMLEKVAEMPGNAFRGFGMSYSDKSLRSGDHDADIEDLKLTINGSMAGELQKMVQDNPQMEGFCAYNMVRVMRGTEPSELYAQDEVHNNGYFALKRGKSVDDHVSLLEMCREAYSKMVKGVERMRIGTRREGTKTVFEGRPFDFQFHRDIGDLDSFISKLFNSTAPFNLWGMKSEVSDGYFRVLAIDLHTGSPLNFEIAGDMMRVYLDKGSCGNTILRLLTNLQMYHDSRDVCVQVRDNW